MELDRLERTATRLRCSLFDLIGPHNRWQVLRMVNAAMNAETLGRANREIRAQREAAQ